MAFRAVLRHMCARSRRRVRVPERPARMAIRTVRKLAEHTRRVDAPLWTRGAHVTRLARPGLRGEAGVGDLRAPALSSWASVRSALSSRRWVCIDPGFGMNRYPRAAPPRRSLGAATRQHAQRAESQSLGLRRVPGLTFGPPHNSAFKLASRRIWSGAEAPRPNSTGAASRCLRVATRCTQLIGGKQRAATLRRACKAARNLTSSVSPTENCGCS
jgi:hypothetical protein